MKHTSFALTRVLDRLPRPPAAAGAAREREPRTQAKTPAAVIALDEPSVAGFEFIARRSERGRNVVVVRAPRGASNAAVIAFAERVGPDRNPFGCQVRRYGDEAEVAFHTE